MRALIIGKIWPEPTSSAAGQRTMDLVDSLASARWELHFACAAQKSEYSQDLEKTQGVCTHQIHLNDDRFDAWVANLAPDIVVFDRYMTEEQFGWRVEKVLPEALRVVDTSDLHLLREARRSSLLSGEALDLSNPIALREVASLYRSDLSLLVSEYEMTLAKAHFGLPEQSIAYWPLAIELPVDDTPGFADRAHFVMIGSFLHQPNWDAVRYCHDEIWPLIRDALPQAELHVYGSYATEKAKQLHAPDRGFLVEGRAADALATLRQYRVNLAPLRYGAGLKGKLFDGFRTGTPTVASSIALEGICGSLPWGSPAADRPAEFAAAAVELHESRDLWSTARDCGRAIAEARFAKPHWQQLLPKLLAEAHAKRSENRRANFFGQLLRHHANRSTEYMSRWIQAKNK